MDRKLIASKIDHAILKPQYTYLELLNECEVAKKYNVASVCVKPSDVEFARELLANSEVKVCTVIGFPHGVTTTATKVAETKDVITKGATEVDMVINIGRLMSNDYNYVKNDINKVVEVAHKNRAIIKVIIETSLIDDEHKAIACKLAEEAGADYVKTSTGFNGGGATLEDIELMINSIDSTKVKVKASGGIKTYEQAVQFIEAGCSRLGTSALVAIMEDQDYQDTYWFPKKKVS